MEDRKKNLLASVCGWLDRPEVEMAKRGHVSPPLHRLRRLGSLCLLSGKQSKKKLAANAQLVLIQLGLLIKVKVKKPCTCHMSEDKYNFCNDQLLFD